MNFLNRFNICKMIAGINIFLYFAASVYLTIRIIKATKSSCNKDYIEHLSLYFILQDCVYLVACVIMVILSAFLLSGIIKKQHKRMTPWIWGSMFIIFYSITVLFHNVLYGIASKDFWILDLIVLISLVVQIIFWFQIYPLYKDVRSQNYSQQHNELVNEMNVISLRFEKQSALP